MKPVVVSFIVPVRNDARRLELCLRSIQANSFSGTRIEIIVVDNGSHDGSPDAARRIGATVIESDASCVAELRNLGAARASGEILAFVDADHEISAAWVRAAVETLRAPDVAITGALCHAPVDGTWVQRAYGLLRGIPRGRHEVEWLGSGNMAIRRTVFEAVRGFDTTLTACEDVDLCNRVRATGARIISNAGLRNVHHGDPATLWAVFKSELWRGRDNLRVSLRSRPSWRGLPSVMMPVVDVLMLVAFAAGLVAAAGGSAVGVAASATAAAIFGAASGLRVVRLFARERRAAPLGLLQAWAVACAYDLGRALALVMRTPHRSTPAEMVAAQ